MAEAGYLIDVAIVLFAVIVAGALFQRLRLGTVLGYLLAGLVIGPHGLALVGEGETIEALAELGVVFLLFTVGLELPLERLRTMRGQILGLGVAQVLLCGAAIAAVALLLGAAPPAAFVVGAALALSSTAIVLRLLSERGEITSRFGRSAVAVLLAQDLAVGPLLVLVLALGAEADAVAPALGWAALKSVAAVALILGLGRLVLRAVYLPVATTRNPETFAALTLLVVIAAGLLTLVAGLSMAFGAFLAGMLLAETHYRHQVAADIQSVRGLLLGLFFMTVGMSVDLEVVLHDPGQIALLVGGLLLGKLLVLAALARAFGAPFAEAIRLGLLLSQGGEFAFVLLGAGLAVAALSATEVQLLTLVVTITMMLTPLLARAGSRAAGRLERAGVPQAAAAGVEPAELGDHVLIAGFGRVGETVADQLGAAGIPFVAVDLDPHRVAAARRRGRPVFYGDATHPDVLDALHVDRAAAVVVSLDSPRAALQLVAMLRYIFPVLRIFARAYDEVHAASLEEAGADRVVPEMSPTGQRLAAAILEDRQPPPAAG